MSTAGGALERLLWNGLYPGVYELSERDVGAKLAPVDKETVLLFQLDDPHDELRRDEPKGTQICDGLHKIKASLGFVPCPLKGVADLREELRSRVQHD